MISKIPKKERENELFATNTSQCEVIAESKEVKKENFTDTKVMHNSENLLTAQEEIDLAQKMRKGDKKAREKLILSNKKLVEFIAKNYADKGLEWDDLVQSGQIGLIEAVEKFNPDKGFRLSTLATWWIKKEILKNIHKNGRLIRLPEYIKEKCDKIAKAKSEYTKANGEDPSVEVLAKITGESVESVNHYITLTMPVVSIYDMLKDSDDEFCKWLKDNGDSPEEVLEKESLYECLRKSLDELDQREKQVIKLRFGLDGESPKKQQEIGDILNTTRQNVRKIEEKALKKLRYTAIIENL